MELPGMLNVTIELTGTLTVTKKLPGTPLIWQDN